MSNNRSNCNNHPLIGFSPSKKIEMLEKGMKRREVINNYNNALFEYKNHYGLNYNTIFDFPYDWFRLFQGRLYFSRNNLEVTNNTIEVLFLDFKLPYKEGDIKIRNLIISLKKVLKIRKPLSYYEHIQNYKIMHNLVDCFFLDDPVNFFFMFDENLCCDIQLNHIIPITDKVVQDLFKIFQMPLPTYYERKKIFYSLAKMNQEVKEENGNNENPYFIYFKYKSTLNLIEYCKDTMSFKRTSIENNPRNICKKVEIDNKENNNTYYPKNFSKLLYLLSKGDIKIIDQLSEVFASIFATKNITKKMTVFYVSEKFDLWMLFLASLINDYEYQDKDISFKAMCDSKNIKKLIDYKLQGKFCIINYRKNLPEVEKINTFRKIINSRPFTAKDSFLGKKTFINNMHLIYITEKHKDIIKLSNNYKINLIHLNCSSTDIDGLIDIIGDSNIELSWIRTAFTLHGLKRIAERNLGMRGESKGKKSLSKNDGININDFITSCCKVSNSAKSYAADLYEYYIEYYNKCYGGQPLKRREFVKELKQLGKYKYSRPHHSRNDNRYAFQGITIDIEKFEKAIDVDIEDLKSRKKQDEINEYLSSMNNLLTGVKFSDSEMNVKIVRGNYEND